MPSALKKYAFINAKLRTRLSLLLTEEFYESLIRAHSLIDAMALLKNTAYAELEAVFSQTGDLKTSELALYGEEILVYRDVERRVDGVTREFCAALITYYEIENLKRAVRLWFDRVIRGRQVEDAIGYLSREPIHFDLNIDTLLSAGGYQGVSQALAGTPYGRLFDDSIPDIERMNSLFAFEIALDKHYYGELLRIIATLAPADARIARRLVGVEIDLLNINWVIRFRTLYNLPLEEALRYAIPSGFEVDAQTIARAYDQERAADVFDALMKKHKGFGALLKEQAQDATSRLVLIERILEHVMMSEVRKLLGAYPFSIGIILAYFILKKNELKKIMTIMNAKLYALKPEEIKSRL